MKLFEPLNINGMVIPNRIMVPAMVTHLCKEDGIVTEDSVNRYARYARGGTGLIVVEAMAVHHVKSGPLLRISDDSYIAGLSRIPRKVHETSDSKIVPQIIHFLKVARSGWRQTVDMLTREEIDLIVEQFGDAVRRAREAGFDGAELHSAHAYTLSSFLSRTNSIILWSSCNFWASSIIRCSDTAYAGHGHGQGRRLGSRRRGRFGLRRGRGSDQQRRRRTQFGR